MTAPQWTDGTIVAVAWYAAFNYRHAWDRLRDVDAALDVDEIDALLQQVRAAGNPVGADTPARLPAGAEVALQIVRLGALVERVRRAVGLAFVGADALPDRIWARCRHPRVYLTLPPPELAPADEVESIHLGDLPPRTFEWQQRARLAGYRRLQVLTLFNLHLGGHGLGIDVGPLDRLACLDLRDNGFDAVPGEVLRCPSLRWLHLGGNPLTQLPDLTALPRLAFLGIGETAIAAADVARLRRQRPGLHVEAAAA